MTGLVATVAVAALVGVVLLAFAYSSLLGMLREVQLGLAERGPGAHLVGVVEPVAALANRSRLDSDVLVVEAGCASCRSRAARLAVLAEHASATRLLMLTADERCAEWARATPVSVIVDAAAIRALGVTSTPLLIRVDHDGRERWRRVVTSDAELDRLVGSSPASREPVG